LAEGSRVGVVVEVRPSVVSVDAGLQVNGFRKLYRTMLEYLYLVSFRLVRDFQTLDVWHGSSAEWIEHAVEVPHELLSLWDDAAYIGPEKFWTTQPSRKRLRATWRSIRR